MAGVPMSKQRANREAEEPSCTPAPAATVPYEPTPPTKEQELARDYQRAVDDVVVLREELKDAQQEEQIARSHRADVETQLRLKREHMKKLHEELSKLVNA